MYEYIPLYLFIQGRGRKGEGEANQGEGLSSVYLSEASSPPRIFFGVDNAIL
jgi:hypothetical protein